MMANTIAAEVFELAYERKRERYSWKLIVSYPLSSYYRRTAG
jgi:hypothetical protein